MIQVLWILCEAVLPSVPKLQYIMDCRITLHVGNKLPLQHYEIAAENFYSVTSKFSKVLVGF